MRAISSTKIIARKKRRWRNLDIDERPETQKINVAMSSLRDAAAQARGRDPLWCEFRAGGQHRWGCSPLSLTYLMSTLTCSPLLQQERAKVQFLVYGDRSWWEFVQSVLCVPRPPHEHHKFQCFCVVDILIFDDDKFFRRCTVYVNWVQSFRWMRILDNSKQSAGRFGIRGNKEVEELPLASHGIPQS
jgi:hypothetical protein